MTTNAMIPSTMGGLVPTSGTQVVKGVDYAIPTEVALDALVKAAIYQRALAASEALLNSTPLPVWAERWTAYSISLTLKALKDDSGRPLFINHLFSPELQREGVQTRVHRFMDAVLAGIESLPVGFTDGMEDWVNDLGGGEIRSARTYYPDLSGNQFYIPSTATATTSQSVQPVAALPSIGVKFQLPD